VVWSWCFQQLKARVVKVSFVTKVGDLAYSVGSYKITSVRTGGADREHVPTAAQDRRRTKFAENAEAVLSWLTPANAAPTLRPFQCMSAVIFGNPAALKNNCRW
jgi:hypothetical protein